MAMMAPISAQQAASVIEHCGLEGATDHETALNWSRIFNFLPPPENWPSMFQPNLAAWIAANYAPS